MALQAPVSRFGFTFPDAYHRVQSYFGDKVSTTFTVRVYANAQARLDNAEHLLETTHQCSYEPDVLTACYNFLKEQGVYADALDV